MLLYLYAPLPDGWNLPKIKEQMNSFAKVVECKKIKKGSKKTYYRIRFQKTIEKNNLKKFLEKRKIEYRFIEESSNAHQKAPNVSQSQVHKEDQSDSKISLKPSVSYNLSYQYYRSKDYGKSLVNFKLDRRKLQQFSEFFAIAGTETFSLETTYPGLIVGTGYTHPKRKDNKDDFQLGFFFDHTSGMPLIPGSSVKGVLRSVFPLPGEKLATVKRAYMKEVFQIDDETIDLAMRCFEDNKTIFYDAYIGDTSDERGHLFADDYITPHGDSIQEPNPIHFLKIRPGVQFVFQFRADKKLVQLFKRILLQRGIGAKTNVGYGQFQEPKKM